MLFNSKVNPVMFIAEVGSNHEGNFLEAKKLVINASKSNADVIKLQIFTAENMVAKKYDRKRFDHFKKLQLNKSQNQILKGTSAINDGYCRITNREVDLASMA